jgi:hypothetical protein
MAETLPEKPMIQPTVRTMDGSNTIRLRWLRSFSHHHARRIPWRKRKQPGVP